MTAPVDSKNDFYLENFKILANILFALCMFASVLKVEFTSNNLSQRDLAELLRENINAFFNFIVAFAFLAMYWVKFVGKLHYIRTSDAKLLGGWLVYLAVLCIYPFAENLLGNYPGEIIAQIVFSSLWAAIGIVSFANWWYANKAGLVDPQMSPVTSKRLLFESFPEPAIALLSIPFALVSDWAYYGIMLLIVPTNFMISRRFSE